VLFQKHSILVRQSGEFGSYHLVLLRSVWYRRGLSWLWKASKPSQSSFQRLWSKVCLSCRSC